MPTYLGTAARTQLYLPLSAGKLCRREGTHNIRRSVERRLRDITLQIWSVFRMHILFSRGLPLPLTSARALLLRTGAGFSSSPAHTLLISFHVTNTQNILTGFVQPRTEQELYEHLQSICTNRPRSSGT